jgi:uncharacterized protein YihD (DUF1040 family)
MKLTPRKPERIDPVIELLREAWQLAPDLRLTQLVVNAAEASGSCAPIYYIEDDEMERRLRAFVLRLREHDKRQHSGN